MKKILLLTHFDLDGQGCAILGRLAWQDNVDIIVCKNPQDCGEKLLKEYNKIFFENYFRVFITDTSFPEEILNDTLLLSVLKDKLRLFDHHKTAEGLLKYFPDAVVQEKLDGQLTCGTSLFHKHLTEKWGLSARPWFVEQVRLLDTWEWAKGTSLMPKYLNLLCYMKGFNSFVESFSLRLKKKDLNELNVFTQAERDILEYEVERNSKEVEKNTSNVIKVMTNKYFVGVVNVTTGDFSTLGNTICNTYGVDIACMFNVTTGGISLRSTRDDINLGQILKQSVLKGGGHALAAGANLGEAFCQEITTMVVKKILGEDIDISSIEFPSKK